MYRYALKNIKWMYRSHRVFFFLIVLIMAFSSAAAAFFYGLHGNYQNRLLSMQTAYNRLRLEIVGEVTKGELADSLEAFPAKLQEKLKAVIVEAEAEEELRMQVHFQMADGAYQVCQVFQENILRNGMADTYFSDEDEAEGQPVALIGSSLALREGGWTTGANIYLNGKAYRIIGRQSWLDEGVLVPFASLDDEVLLAADTGIQLHFMTPLTSGEYEQIQGIFTVNLGNRIRVPQVEVIDENAFRLYRTIVLAVAAVTLLAGINFVILYQYILIRRRKMMAVFRLCGLTKGKRILLYLEECMTLCLLSAGAGILLFGVAAEPVMERIFLYLDGVYNVRVYVGIYLLFAVISLFLLAGFALAEGHRRMYTD